MKRRREEENTKEITTKITIDETITKFYLPSKNFGKRQKTTNNGT